MIYTGIGARNTPPEILEKMQSLGRFLANWGYTLRSGGAKGADKAFETGCKQKSGDMEIYLPHKGFNGNLSELHTVTKEARQMAKVYHPNWSSVGPRGRDYMGRNAFQILGLDLNTPTDFVVCWTPGGKPVGGTSQAIRMADRHRIPVFNFGSASIEIMEQSILKIIEPKKG